MVTFDTKATVARAVAAFACVAILAHWLLLALARPTRLPDEISASGTWVVALFALLFLAVGVLIVGRHPANRLAWVYIAVGSIFALDTFASALIAWSTFAGHGPRWTGDLGIWLNGWLWFPAVALVGTLALLLFPDGRPPGSRWNWVTPVSLAAIAVGSMGIAFEEQPLESLDLTNPIAPPARVHLVVEIAAAVGVLTTVACFTVCAAAIVVRFRRSRGVERQQMKLLALAGGVVGVVFPLSFLLWDVAPWIVLVQTVALAALPVAAGVAILRYRLWDVDLLINRALVYGALAVAIGAVYAAVIGAFAAALNERSGLWPSLVAAGVAVALVQPTRAWLQRRVNRFLYGDRDEPYAALSRLGRRLQETPAPEDVLPAIVESVAQALRVPAVSIQLERDGGFETAASAGRVPAVGDPVVLPLVHRGETVGRLVLHPRPGERLDRRDVRLLEDLAGQAGAAVHAVRLTAELRSSRERTVAAREEERRRLRRDLHDGLGPALAGIALKLDGVRASTRGDPDAADEALLELRGQVQEAIAEIRRLVYELRPPALDELGLVGSLRERATTLGATVEAPEALPTLPAAVEVAAYRIALEAMANAARHARATACVVRLSLDEALEIEVADDGCGLAPQAQPGVGLASMRERAAELGGTLDVGAGADGGTRVLARLPLPA